MPLLRLSLLRLLLLDHFRPGILFSQHRLSNSQHNPLLQKYGFDGPWDRFITYLVRRHLTANGAG
jgi:hypothetical protein